MRNSLLILLVFSMGFFPSCNEKGESDPVASCTDGIQNQDETGVDCGGRCIECFDCFTEYCTHLSGGVFDDNTSSIQWKCTMLDGVPFVPDLGDVTQVILSVTRYTFNNKGVMNFISTDVDRDGRWEFDNPENPTRIYFNFPDEEYNFYMNVTSLNEDELKVVWYEGAIATFEPVN